MSEIAVPEERRFSVRRLTIPLLLIAALAALGIMPRVWRNNRAAAIAREATTGLPVVITVRAQAGASTAELALPGNTEAIIVSAIYARANGYVRERFVDIGSKVKAGQVLAVIESPEVDQELAQARASLEQSKASLQQTRAGLEQARAALVQSQANLQQAKANEEIAATTNQRWSRLVERGVLAKQAGDERRTQFAARQAETAAASAAINTSEANVQAQQANVLAAQAALQAQQANVTRLERLQAFQRVVAPFEGVITERNIERGDLITAGSGSDRNLFSIAQSRTLRIQVFVPQAFAVDVHPGQQAQVLVRERAGQAFPGKVARTANALDGSSRTLLTEIQVDNKDGALMPGMYAQVKFALPRNRPVIVVPADTLLADAKGTRVLSVTAQKSLHYIPVQVGRDLGPQIEILDGLSGNEILVANPSDVLAEGQQVEPKPLESISNPAAEGKAKG